MHLLLWRSLYVVLTFVVLPSKVQAVLVSGAGLAINAAVSSLWV